jgi:diaminopropionate ammonia-lyase
MGDFIYNNEAVRDLGGEGADDLPLAFHRRLPDYRVTPLVDLGEPAARRFGVGRVWIKDESERLGLPAFKILGASWGVYRTIAERAPELVTGLDSPGSLRERLRSLGSVTLVTASDGNHGRAVARVASWFGFGARVFMPAGTILERIRAIESEGAMVTVIDGDYDAAVGAAASFGRGGQAGYGVERWLIQDTAWNGYERIPSWIVEGYWTIFREIEEQLAALDSPDPDLVIVQIGVGSLAASAVRFYRAGARRSFPRIVGVEPVGAACAYASVQAGHPVTVPGPHRSHMAGLNCGTLSSIAWPYIARGVGAVVVVDDERSFEAMRLLAAHGITAGESGAAGIAALMELGPGGCGEGVRDALGIDRSSSVLVISTEGITNPTLYRRIVGR